MFHRYYDNSLKYNWLLVGASVRSSITVIFSRINLLPDNEAHVILAMPGEGEHDSVTFSYTESMQ